MAQTRYIFHNTEATFEVFLVIYKLKWFAVSPKSHSTAFMPVIDAALIFSWSADWPNSAIDKPKTVIKGTPLYLDGICIFF